ncbi:50S ribosomal protein L23 [bacterium]|nr:50S ribosomal protein L23 [bacterium]
MKRFILKRPIQTERALVLQDRRNQYVFEVDVNANKIEIRRAIENKFSVKVKSIRTLVVKGKNVLRFTKKVKIAGRTSDWKKAIVTLEDGNSINFFGEA